MRSCSHSHHRSNGMKMKHYMVPHLHLHIEKSSQAHHHYEVSTLHMFVTFITIHSNSYLLHFKSRFAWPLYKKNKILEAGIPIRKKESAADTILYYWIKELTTENNIHTICTCQRTHRQTNLLDCNAQLHTFKTSVKFGIIGTNS
jgi:hypothetical protein